MKIDFKKCLPYLPLCLLFLAILVYGLIYVFRPYTITIDLGDGSKPIKKTYSIASGNIPLGTPEREGYRFTGWTGTNGSVPQKDVVVKSGSIGNRRYVAKWTGKLIVRCQDWIIDADGRLVANITDSVDQYLKSGSKKVRSRYKKRWLKVNAGDVVDPADWGEVEDRNYYSDRYMYVGNSGKTTVTENETIIYRYFYPVFSVAFRVNNQGIKSFGVKSLDLARFNLYFDGKKVASNVNTYAQPVPVGTKYYVEMLWTNAEYRHLTNGNETGTVGGDKCLAVVNFATREEDYTATCRDILADAKGNEIKDITASVDSYLRSGKCEKDYPLIPRTVEVGHDEGISGQDWGNDTSPKAYHSDYCYGGSSEPVLVDDEDVEVLRYFYPTLDIRITVDGMHEAGFREDDPDEKNDKTGTERFDLYVDGEPVALGVSSYKGGVPYGSTYEVRNAVSDQGYIYVPGEKDTGVMGDKGRTIKIDFASKVAANEEELTD